MKDDRALMLLAALAAGLIGYGMWRGQSGARASWARRVGPSAIEGAALDASLGRITPDHLLWFGPPQTPAHYTPHRVTYPVTPGREMQRLIHGAPGSCVTPAVPAGERGWLFSPPSEVDY